MIALFKKCFPSAIFYIRMFGLKVVLFLSLFIFHSKSNSQIVTIPDPNFVIWLEADWYCSACITGNQLDTQCPGVFTITDMNLASLNITDLTGVEYFLLLDSLNVTNNVGITNINMPSGVSYFNCSFCQLTDLPTLPDSLQFLICKNNFLDSLPVLPFALSEIDCSNNLLTDLPGLPDSLDILDCSENQITYLPTLPDSLKILDCDNNPNLACLPVLPNSLIQVGFDLGYLWVAGTLVTCIPNLPAGIPGPPWYPICTDTDLVNNPFGCVHTSGIYGNTFQDTSGNCALDYWEPLVSNTKFYLLNNLGDTIGLSYSSYYFFHFSDIPDGDYTILLDTVTMPYTVGCANPGIDSNVTIVGGSNMTDVNFDVTCKSGFDVGVQSIIPIGAVFPGNDHTLRVFAGDMLDNFWLDCASGISGQVDITVIGNYTYIGPGYFALTPSSISGNTYSYLISDFSSVNFNWDFGLIFNIDSLAQIGDTICINVTVTPTIGDNNITNNSLDYCYVINNSYDPNIKEVYPEVVLPDYNDWLTYTIHFQNTGTAAAYNIKLTDTLDILIRENTFELMTYSHPVEVELQGNIATFRFNDIMLPDSASNPEGSIGYIQYRVRPENNLPEGTQIDNKVYIYFDYNSPIITNTATTYFTEFAAIPVSDFFPRTPYPNPSSGIFNIMLPINFSSENCLISIYNLAGEKVMELTTSNPGIISLDLTSEKSGIYLMTISNGEEIVTSKLVKY